MVMMMYVDVREAGKQVWRSKRGEARMSQHDLTCPSVHPGVHTFSRSHANHGLRSQHTRHAVCCACAHCRVTVYDGAYSRRKLRQWELHRRRDGMLSQCSRLGAMHCIITYLLMLFCRIHSLAAAVCCASVMDQRSLRSAAASAV